MHSVLQMWIRVSDFEAGGTQVPSNIDLWTIFGPESSVLVQTELNSCFERNKVALKIDVLCDNCPSHGVGISNPGFWGMVRITKKLSLLIWNNKNN
jgi:alpha-N-arabinofuranosidase